MKIRMGFVSNSSSQSFVMIGVDISQMNYKDLLAKLLEKNPKPGIDANDVEDICINDILDGYTERGSEGGIPHIGLELASASSEDSLPWLKLDIADIEEKAKQVEVLFASIGISVKAKLIAGTDYC